MSVVQQRRRGVAERRSPTVGERGSRAARRGLWGVARLVNLVASIVAAVLVIGILLVLLEANRDNSLVDAVLDAAKWLAGPFDNVFEPDGRKARVAVNWGLATVVYLIAARLITRLLAR